MITVVIDVVVCFVVFLFGVLRIVIITIIVVIIIFCFVISIIIIIIIMPEIINGNNNNNRMSPTRKWTQFVLNAVFASMELSSASLTFGSSWWQWFLNGGTQKQGKVENKKEKLAYHARRKLGTF